MKNRQQNWDFDRRISRLNNDFMGRMKVCYDESLASSDGMHFHCWIPVFEDKNHETDFYTAFIRECKRQRDAVSFSWDYLPKGHL